MSTLDHRRARVSNIQVNYRVGIHQAVQHLKRLGHSRLALVAGPRPLKSATLRREAFLECVVEAFPGAPPPLIVEGDHTLDAGSAATPALLCATPRPTAVLCSNDLTAIGVLRGLDAEGLRAPRDMSVVGFDDIRMAEFTTPPLTTIRLSRLELARLSFEALTASTVPEVGYTLDTSLIIRGSTSRP